MLAVGLARQAAETRYRTYLTTAADLTARCHRAAIEGRHQAADQELSDPDCGRRTLCEGERFVWS